MAQAIRRGQNGQGKAAAVVCIRCKAPHAGACRGADEHDWAGAHAAARRFHDFAKRFQASIREQERKQG